MKKLFTKIAIAVAGFTGVAVAQQDPQFTQFMHNKLIYNPGYAGTSGAICGNLQFRQQWTAFDGAPQSLALAVDMPVIPNLGVGLNVITDKIGPMNTLFLRVPVSYLIPVGKNGGKLGLGLDVGILQKKINNTWITPEPGKVDPNIPGAYDALSNPALNKITYDLGFGAFYQIPGTMYVGLSSTHLPAQVVKDGNLSYQMSRHYYAMAGYSIKPNPRNTITPNVKLKSDAAATAVDVNLTYMWDNMIWVGGTYRVGDAAAFMVGYQSMTKTKNLSYKIGYSYDLTTSKLKGYSGGTHEIILGFCLFKKPAALASYGDDRYLN